jgi:hypothetical protein
MNAYMFDDNTIEREYHRLQLLEAANNPTTIALLQHIGIQPGWSSLELGLELALFCDGWGTRLDQLEQCGVSIRTPLISQNFLAHSMISVVETSQ